MRLFGFLFALLLAACLGHGPDSCVDNPSLCGARTVCDPDDPDINQCFSSDLAHRRDLAIPPTDLGTPADLALQPSDLLPPADLVLHPSDLLPPRD